MHGREGGKRERQKRENKPVLGRLEHTLEASCMNSDQQNPGRHAQTHTNYPKLAQREVCGLCGALKEDQLLPTKHDDIQISSTHTPTDTHTHTHTHITTQ